MMPDKYPDNIWYILYRDDGSLIGAYYRIPSEEDESHMLLVEDYVAWNWYLYRMNAARDGVELIPYIPTNADYTLRIHDALNNGVTPYGYENIVEACTYALSTLPAFKAKGDAAVVWRDRMWTYLADLLAKIEAGTIERPSFPEFAAGFPALDWPVDPAPTDPVQSGN